jgi:hypothetical protein
VSAAQTQRRLKPCTKGGAIEEILRDSLAITGESAPPVPAQLTADLVKP